MNQDELRLSMKLNTRRAQEELKELNKLIEETQNSLQESISMGPDISTGSLDKEIAKIIKANRELAKFKSEYATNYQNLADPVMTGKGSNLSKQQQQAYRSHKAQGNVGRVGEMLQQERERNYKKMNQEIQEVTKGLGNLMDQLNYTSENSKDFTTPRTHMAGGHKRFQPSIQPPEHVSRELADVDGYIRDVKDNVRTAMRSMDRSEGAEYISHAEGRRLESSLKQAYFGITGASQGDKAKVENMDKDGVTWDVDVRSPLHKAREGEAKVNDNIQALQDQLVGVRDIIYGLDEEDINTEEIRLLRLTEEEILSEIQQQQTLGDKYASLLSEIAGSINKVTERAEKFDEATGGKGVKTAPDPNSTEGILSSRSNAIALSMVSAMAYTIMNTFREGKSIVDNQRGPSLAIGMGTGDYDFRGIRKDAQQSGFHYGIGGLEMLQQQQTVLGTLGYTDETLGVVDQMARMQRLSGVSEEEVAGLFSTALRTGAITTEEEAKIMQEAIAGGIEDSGMLGRQEEQVSVMSSMLDSLTEGREMSNQEMKQQLALMNIMSSTGSRSLQGENLATNLGGINEQIAGASPYSMLGYLMGVGSNSSLIGPGSLHEFGGMQEEGLLGGDMLQNLGYLFESDPTMAKSVIASLFPSTTYDAREEIGNLFETGEFTPENIQQVIKETERIGAESYQDREEGWEESPDSTAMMKEVASEARKGNVRENWLGDRLTELGAIFEKWGASSAGIAIAMTGTSAIGKSLMTGLSGGGIFAGISKAIKEFFNSSGSSTGGIEEMLSVSGGGAGGGFLSKLGESGIGKFFGGIGEMIPASVTSGVEKLGGWGGVLNAGIQSVKGVYETATADDKLHEGVKQTGRVAGNVGGFALGATAGTLLFPGIGTVGGAIAGGIGGLIGSWGGDKIGEDIGDLLGKGVRNVWDVLKSPFSPQKVKAGEDEAGMGTDFDDYQASLEESDTKEDIATTGSKREVESKRSDNVTKETENLAKWFRLIKDIERVLATARQQNGIIGKGVGGSGGGSGVGGELGYTSTGEYWTNSDIKQHDLGKTSNELTAGDLDAWISSNAKPGSSMLGMGEAFMEAGRQSGLDPRYLVAHSAWETGWGSSNINKDKNNFFGIGAFDNSPYNSAFDWSSPEEGIIGGANWIAENYYNEGETTLAEMNKRYATDPNWAGGIASVMKGSENFTKPSGDVSISTTVNLNSTGNSKNDGKIIAGEVNRAIDSRFSNEYVPI